MENNTPVQPSPKRAPNHVPVSKVRPKPFYIKSVVSLFSGTKEEEGLNEVMVTGLGTAISAAVSIADQLVGSKYGNIKKVDTSYHISETTERPVPKITFIITKHPDFVPVYEEAPPVVEAK
eukprot:Platyproteum_vivax@DN16692_c0_g1_i1.p1